MDWSWRSFISREQHPQGRPSAPSCLQTHTCPLSQLGCPDLEPNPRRSGEGGYFIYFLFRERQTGWSFIDLEKETLAKLNTQQALKKQDVHDVMPGFTLVSPFIIRTDLGSTGRRKFSRSIDQVCFNSMQAPHKRKGVQTYCWQPSPLAPGTYHHPS